MNITQFEKNKIMESRIICPTDKPIDFDTTIYRIMSVDRLIEALSTKKFSMVKTKKWEDPFENLFLKSEFRIDGKILDVKSIHDSYFGVCWSLTKENDAMWRIYSQDKWGVKIKTNIEKIFKRLYSSLSEKEKLHLTVGAVEYCEQNVIIKYLESFGQKDFIDSDNRIIPSTLLFKRNEFRFEDEIRFLYSKTKLEEDLLFFYDFNWFDIIEEIEFDPRLDVILFDCYRNILSKNFGIDEQLIKLSKLYQPMTLSINL